MDLQPLRKNAISHIRGYFGKLAGEEHTFRFFQTGLAWSNRVSWFGRRASCCNRLAAKGTVATQLAAETEVSASVQTFS